MFIKRYVAKSLPQVLSVIKAELGSEAVILSKRKIRAGGWSGLFGLKVYEVVAGRERDDPPRQASAGISNMTAGFMAMDVGDRESSAAPPEPKLAVRGSSPGSESARSVENAADAVSAARYKVERAVDLAPSVKNVADSALERELRDLRGLLTAMFGPGGGLPGLDRTALGRVVERLMHAQLPAPLLQRFIMTEAAHADIRDARAVDAALTQFARTLLKETEPVRTIGDSDRVVAFFGPTGVGKTTTIAKLAARAKLHDGRSVGLLTVDTFRVAAVEQLKTYADILNIPFAVARSAAETK